MFNLIALIICTAGAILQWNNDWWLFGCCAFFAIGNGYFAVDWISKKIKKEKED